MNARSPFYTICPAVGYDRVEVFNDRKKPLGFLSIVNAEVDYFFSKFSSKQRLIRTHSVLCYPLFSLYVVLEASVLCKVHVGYPRLLINPFLLGLENTVEDVTRDPRHDVRRDPPRGRRG